MGTTLHAIVELKDGLTWWALSHWHLQKEYEAMFTLDVCRDGWPGDLSGEAAELRPLIDLPQWCDASDVPLAPRAARPYRHFQRHVESLAQDQSFSTRVLFYRI